MLRYDKLTKWVKYYVGAGCERPIQPAPRHPAPRYAPLHRFSPTPAHRSAPLHPIFGSLRSVFRSAHMLWSRQNQPRDAKCPGFEDAVKTTIIITRNSSGDEIANVNYICDDIVHALKYNRLLHKFRHRSFSATQVYQIQ